jgi:radical SAM protein with 4Fe4S-binding SPASM domain
MCRTWQRRAAKELAPHEIGALIRDVPRLTWLDVTGGEPFVRADITDVFAAILDNAHALHVLHFQTNGWQTARIVDTTATVARRQDVIVTVSLDGPPALHDRIRGRTGAFTRALATARALADLRSVEVHIGTTVTRTNVDAIDDLGDYLQANLPGFSPRRWHLNWFQSSAHFFGNGNVDAAAPVDTEIATHLRRRGLPRSLVELMEAVYLVNLDAHRRGEPSPAPCQALRSTAFVSPEGDVYPCHIYDRPLGNVRDGFDRIWHAAHTHAARRDIERLACGGCFSACEAYPALAGAPLRTAVVTTSRLARMIVR